MFNVNNKDTRTTPCRSDIFSKIAGYTNVTKSITPKWRRSGIFIANFEHNSHLALTLSRQMATAEVVSL